MDGIRHSRQFAEIERLVSDYFHCHLAPVMSKTQAFLTKKQGEEMREYSTSLGGILSAMASAAQPMSDPYQVLKVTGEWNSKTTEDYIGMCKAEITGSKEIQQDLAYMAGQWRDTVVREIGRERYDELSEQLGGDLAYAYMDYRVEELMIDRLVKERMPKSSAEYIIRKAAESSLLGLSQTLNHSPLSEEIEARGEAAYRPKGWEKGAGRVLGATADTVMMGGVGSWATLAKFVGADVAISAVASRFEPEKPDTLSVEQCISKGVFGSERNVFTDFRKEAATMQTGKSELITAANEQLKKKTPVVSFNFSEWLQIRNHTPFFWMTGQDEKEPDRAERYKDVPLVVAPGREEAYLNDLAKKSNVAAATPQKESTETEQREKVEKEERQTVIPHEEKTQEEPPVQTNTRGWSGLFGTLGLEGLGDITGNLGYVMAMLPDILLGAFTGKTQSLRFGDNLLPIASIVAGLFVRNPLLKMLLVGLGGANLLNKAGHEALGRPMSSSAGHTENQYRRYPDEPLNSRIVNPVLQGSTLIATIDRVPCTIQLTPTVAEAYRAGALPLNTLANAVLAKSDQLNRIASQNYDDGQRETIVRTRGIQ
ncbi:hypothetical protein F2Y36_07350 [Bacteroides caccae]|uniref:Uncharacterized protein n=1 Tax=Bacteroides caccae TaxID=47678 RepID=A0A6L3KUT7_9BACE|nr:MULTISPECIES: hypothetical protein [Bacteroides]KAA5444891.1 hypothetical protein F2Y45_08210 [Bacteroides caccae]KAA5464204.1 hypothetical protein F2Y36_07350 [Bacteroides caccae]MCA6035528.1 hypothetical protein [Bacteroides thetaiotaomicron]